VYYITSHLYTHLFPTSQSSHLSILVPFSANGQINQSTQQFKNRILTTLPELARLVPNLSKVDLPQEKMLIDGDATHGYFMEEGVASVVVTLTDGETVEVGIVGLEGMVGLPIGRAGTVVPLIFQSTHGFRLHMRGPFQ
jgi:hypothetical protein